MPNETATAGILFLTLFFVIEFVLVTYGGAGAYFDGVTEITEAPPPTHVDFGIPILDMISNPLEDFWSNVNYFFGLFLVNPALGIFNVILMIPYSIMLMMYIAELLRGS